MKERSQRTINTLSSKRHREKKTSLDKLEDTADKKYKSESKYQIQKQYKYFYSSAIQCIYYETRWIQVMILQVG